MHELEPFEDLEPTIIDVVPALVMLIEDIEDAPTEIGSFAPVLDVTKTYHGEPAPQ